MVAKANSIELPQERDYVPYQPGPFRIGMDLQPLNPAEWIEIDRLLPDQLTEKRRLLAERYREVFAVLPQAEPGARETLKLLLQHLQLYFPQLYDQRGDRLVNRVTGESWSLADDTIHPLELAGRLVQEDFCLMGRDPEKDVYRLIGASVCFPSRWRLAEKLGLPINEIHIPVPTYAERLGTAMNRLFDRLRVEKPVWRMNWGVVDDGALFQPVVRPRPPDAPPITADNAGDWLWLRMERQTLRRLPASRDVLFTIRIYSHPLWQLAQKPRRATALAAALRGLDESMQAYKSVAAYRDAVIGWLERTAAESG